MDTEKSMIIYEKPCFIRYNPEVDNSLKEVYKIINVRKDVEKIIKYIQQLENNKNENKCSSSDFYFTPYNKEVDKAMCQLSDFDSFSPYQENLSKVYDYIAELENIIYGYTE